jgi:hypothetical protein
MAEANSVAQRHGFGRRKKGVAWRNDHFHQQVALRRNSQRAILCLLTCPLRE